MSRFVLLGHPVGHSLSPVIHRAAYQALGVEHDYELIDAPNDAAVKDQVERLRTGEVSGANVTVPHKRLALALADERDPSAQRIGAANVLSRNSKGSIVAHNTDALGLAEVLRRLAPKAKRASVLGNGGASLACVVACAHLGVGEVLVTARSFSPTLPPGSWPHADQFRRLGALTMPWLGSDAEARAAIAASQLVLQATSAGMQGADSGQALCDLLPWSQFARDTAVYDLVYNPPNTPCLQTAEAHGLVAEGGLSMLVAQARLAIQIWLGTLPPAQPLMLAAQRALEGVR